METVEDEARKLPFSQRNGYRPVPPQLRLEEVSDQQRRLVDYHITEEITRNTNHRSEFSEEWERVAKELHVRFFEWQFGDFRNYPVRFNEKLSNFILRNNKFFGIFDLIEFLCNQDNCSDQLKRELSRSFVESRSAYRMVDLKTIVAVGNEELANTYLGALDQTSIHEAKGGRVHLINAGKLIKDGNYSDSVRESIEAVEAVAKKLVPKSSTLGDALKTLSKRHSWNAQLRVAIQKLYAYTNAEKGIRHSLVSEEKANVDEADALFMLGVCASLVTFLLLREVQLKS